MAYAQVPGGRSNQVSPMHAYLPTHANGYEIIVRSKIDAQSRGDLKAISFRSLY